MKLDIVSDTELARQIKQYSGEMTIFYDIEKKSDPHCAIICGKPGCGKTEFVLDLLETEYRGVFEHIIILCPIIQWNNDYNGRPWIGDVRKSKIRNIIIVNPVCNGEEKLQELELGFFSPINMLVRLLCLHWWM